MTTSVAFGGVLKSASISLTEAAFCSGLNSPSSWSRIVGSGQPLFWRYRTVSLKSMALRGSQRPSGLLTSAPINWAGSAPPQSERTQVSAEVPDRAMPNTNRASGRVAAPGWALSPATGLPRRSPKSCNIAHLWLPTVGDQLRVYGELLHTHGMCSCGAQILQLPFTRAKCFRCWCVDFC